MIKYIFLICLILVTNKSFSESFKNIRKYCSDNRCTKVIKKINVGKFYFKTRNCETKDYRKCQIWFGTPNNKLRAGWIKYYRIINGPLPLELKCISGQPIWFQDIPFPEKLTKEYEGIKTLKELNLQNKEKIYYNRPANEHFKFFSNRDKSFGVLINKRNPKGSKKNDIYIFNIENEKMKKIEIKCSIELNSITIK